jgi:hypothetical protein
MSVELRNWLYRSVGLMKCLFGIHENNGITLTNDTN